MDVWGWTASGKKREGFNFPVVLPGKQWLFQGTIMAKYTCSKQEAGRPKAATCHLHDRAISSWLYIGWESPGEL